MQKIKTYIDIISSCHDHVMFANFFYFLEIVKSISFNSLLRFLFAMSNDPNLLLRVSHVCFAFRFAGDDFGKIVSFSLGTTKLAARIFEKT